MEFHGTAGVIQIGPLQVTWYSIEVHGTAGVVEIGKLKVQRNSMEYYAISIDTQINCILMSWDISSWWRHQIEIFFALLALCGASTNGCANNEAPMSWDAIALIMLWLLWNACLSLSRWALLYLQLFIAFHNNQITSCPCCRQCYVNAICVM